MREFMENTTTQWLAAFVPGGVTAEQMEAADWDIEIALEERRTFWRKVSNLRQLT